MEHFPYKVIFQPAVFVNLPHEKVYNCVVTSLNILVLTPLVGERVYQYYFVQGKKYLEVLKHKHEIHSGVYLTKYEAFLTNTSRYKVNTILPYIGITIQIITAMFMLGTAISIKIFFRLQTSQHGKPRITNTISFKRLNIIYCYGLIFSAIMHAIFMNMLGKKTYLAHFTVTMVINTMLLVLAIADREAKQFLKIRIKAWKENHFLHWKIMCLPKRSPKVAPFNERSPDMELFSIS